MRGYRSTGKSYQQSRNNSNFMPLDSPNISLSGSQDMQLFYRGTTRSQHTVQSGGPDIIDLLVNAFGQHFVAVERCFKEISIQMNKLEDRLAKCYGHFNGIEWKLTRELYAIEEAKSLNESLLDINKEIESKMEKMKSDYEDLKRRKYIGEMEERIDSLQEAVRGMGPVGLRRVELGELEDSLQRLEEVVRGGEGRQEVYEDLIVGLLGVVRGEEELGLWVQEKVKENIRMKCRVMQLEYELKELQQDQEQQV